MLCLKVSIHHITWHGIRGWWTDGKIQVYNPGKHPSPLVCQAALYDKVKSSGQGDILDRKAIHTCNNI